ncbi:MULTISPECIES: DUF559 domain-containing protein [unclassified Leifsonia]|uniref:endonuclease domain-containing protein n=1 Tax=unclassified Leifsonia TaxID=2663824 RepID=UPI0011137BE7|nr:MULTISPECIES: DUF559 domain-containing protein [unclassified Leifsonia]
MKQPGPLPPILRSPAFSVRVAVQAGVPVQRLRRTDLDAPFHGARLVHASSGADLLARCAAYRTVMTPGSFFSHTTAASIYGLPVPRRHSENDRLHVSAVLPVRAPKGRGVRGHALSSRPSVRLVRGMRVPEPAEVWCQLASLLTLDELVIVGDALVRRIDPYCEVSELIRAASEISARPGARRIREAIRLVRARTDSPMETVLRLAIVRAGLPEPQVNHPIADGSGRIVASGDLVFPAARLVVEYDGDHHRTDAVQYQTDIDRVYRIESLGWTVVRISKMHMRDGANEALARIRQALKTNGPNMP